MYKNLINSINNSSSSSLSSACNNAPTIKSPSTVLTSTNKDLPIKKITTNHTNGIEHKINDERINSHDEDEQDSQMHSAPSINYEKLVNILLNTISSSPTNTSINNIVMPKLAKLIDSLDRHLELNNELLEQSLSKKKEEDMIEMTRKKHDQNHRQKLQELLIKCLNESVWTLTTADLKERIRYINACLSDTCYSAPVDKPNHFNDMTQSVKRKLSPDSSIEHRPSRQAHFSPSKSWSNQNIQSNNANRLEKAKSFFNKYTQNMNGDTEFNQGDDNNRGLDDEDGTDHVQRNKSNLAHDSACLINEENNFQEEEFESLTNGNDNEYSDSNGLRDRHHDGE